MPRPCKNRFVAGRPGSVVYKPAGIPARTLEWVYLGLDEFETIRLLDHDGLDQVKAAELMGISRPTITRIYASARKKIAEAITEGKAICIEGGPVADVAYRQGRGPGNMQMGHRGRHGFGRGRNNIGR